MTRYSTHRINYEQRLRSRLPYGKWTLADSSEVLFNRYYHPIWRRTPDGVVTPIYQFEWIPWKRQDHFYDDSNLPWCNSKSRQCCETVLKKWGVAC